MVATTKSLVSPSPSTSPAAAQRSFPPGLPAWAVDAARRWPPDSVQALDLDHPDVPYLVGGTAHGRPDGITYTPAQARQWWTAWFDDPVDLAQVSPNLLPGNLVLSASEVKQAQALMGAGSTLPQAPSDYNPLGLPVVP